MYCNQSKCTKTGRHQLDGDECLAWGKSHIQKFMMNMSLVRQEKSLPITCPAKHNTYHIKRGNKQDAERNKQGRTQNFFSGNGSGVHAVFNDKEAENVSQCQTSGVAHKDLASAVGIAKYIVREKGNQDAYTDKGQQSIDPLLVVNEDDSQNGKGNHTQTGGQSVDAVNQVDGIGDEYGQQHGQRDSYKGGNFIDSEKSVEIINIESSQREECGRDDLHKEFLAISHSCKVIGNTDDIQQGEPGNKEEQFGYHGYGELRIGEIS